MGWGSKNAPLSRIAGTIPVPRLAVSQDGEDDETPWSQLIPARVKNGNAERRVAGTAPQRSSGSEQSQKSPAAL